MSRPVAITQHRGPIQATVSPPFQVSVFLPLEELPKDVQNRLRAEALGTGRSPGELARGILLKELDGVKVRTRLEIDLTDVPTEQLNAFRRKAVNERRSLASVIIEAATKLPVPLSGKVTQTTSRTLP